MARRRPRGPRSRTGSYAPQRFRSALSTSANVATAEETAAAAEAAVVEFRDWAAHGNKSTRCVLVELDFIAEVDGAPQTQTLYLSDRVFFDDVTNHSYVDVIEEAPQYARSLSGDGLGTYVSSIGALNLDNANGALDFLRDIACDGSPIRFYFGDVSWPVADFQLIFTAIVAKVTAPKIDRMVVALKDTGLLLDKSIGGNTIGGGGPNTARPRPINFGYIHNGEAILADPLLLKYVHSDDLTGAAVAQDVRDRGVSVAFTDLGNGVAQLSATPDGLITCDVLSEPRGSGKVRVSDAMDHIVGTLAGLSDQSLYAGEGPTFTREDDDDYELGVRIKEARNVIDLLKDITVSGNCFWAVTRLGLFTFGRLRLNDIAAFGLDARTIQEDDYDNGSFSLDHAATQYYKFQALMSRNWTPQSDLAASLAPDDQALYTRPGLYLLQPDGATTAYADRPERYHKTLAISPVIDTLISKEFAVDDVDTLARWMTTRRATQLPWIEIVKMTVGIDFFELELGEPVYVVNPRFGEDDGVLFQVIGNTINLTAARCELTLARRNVIQEVPDSWLRQDSAIDDLSPFSGDRPEEDETITLIDLTVTGLIPSPVTSSRNTNRKWIPGRGIIITRPTPPILPERPYVVQTFSARSILTSEMHQFTFDFSGIPAGDLIIVAVQTAGGSGWSGLVANSGTWNGGASGDARSNTTFCALTPAAFYKVSSGSESASQTFHAFSGSSIRAVCAIIVRGSDGAIYSDTATGFNTTGGSITAPSLGTIAANYLGVSTFGLGSTVAGFTFSVSGGSWAKAIETSSNFVAAGVDLNAGLMIATSPGGALSAATGSWTAGSADCRHAGSYYLKPT